MIIERQHRTTLTRDDGGRSWWGREGELTIPSFSSLERRTPALPFPGPPPPPKKKQQPKNKNKKQQNKTNVDESEQACFNLLCFIFVCLFGIYIWWVFWLSRLITSSQRIIDGISVRFVWVVRCVSWMIWWAL